VVGLLHIVVRPSDPVHDKRLDCKPLHRSQSAPDQAYWHMVYEVFWVTAYGILRILQIGIRHIA
jgi:hypothetical protein